ncbi:Estradiol 17-beta-dehydrogenase 8 [Trichostrongylus colubriformis]|uniref:(3R)-3-hydroxyacyl-CoA dehydrogenase n=1 Tax=Trichostrongylus colubriformis TaxID=6319 RepID=A0AAN8IU55_TRICO
MLSGKFAVVTGGASGIGRAICHRLAQHGAKLVVVDVNKDAAQETVKKIGASANHAFFSCDVSKSDDVARLHEFVLKQNAKSPNIVVNCAGITRDSTLLKMSEKNFDDVVAVNLKGIFLVTQAFAKSAVEEKTPLSVINVSSIVGKVGNFGQCNYAATKAGVVAFGKTVAKELAKKGVRVNSVMPGFIRTPMTEAMPEKVLTTICEGIPMGRMGEPEDIADATVFLASDMSKYMTGATLEVTGGLFM